MDNSVILKVSNEGKIKILITLGIWTFTQMKQSQISKIKFWPSGHICKAEKNKVSHLDCHQYFSLFLGKIVNSAHAE